MNHDQNIIEKLVGQVQDIWLAAPCQEFQFSIGPHVCKILTLMVQNKALFKKYWNLPKCLVEVSGKVEFEIQTKLPNLLRPGKKSECLANLKRVGDWSGYWPNTKSRFRLFEIVFFVGKYIAVIPGPQNAMEYVI